MHNEVRPSNYFFQLFPKLLGRTDVNSSYFSNVEPCILSAFIKYRIHSYTNINGEWSGGAMVLGTLPVPGRPTYFDYSRARAYCACSRCGWG